MCLKAVSKAKKIGGVSKSTLTLNEAIIDVKKVKSKALKWFSIFFEKLQLLLGFVENYRELIKLAHN